MHFEHTERLFTEIKSLDKLERKALMLLLVDKDVIEFVDLATAYVSALRQRNSIKVHSRSTLGLMLASYCINDPSPGGKNARKHLYESGAFGGDK